MGIPGLFAYNNGAEVCFQDYVSIFGFTHITKFRIELATEL